ncbi:MAG TPA: glycosyltransferase family A protein [Bacteroidia bacterium]|jgi:glycosyltransferase involved in cell wall biosynthesis|nr:glycosyltransferase family A protein [Bacteroidia bacterium]
MEVINSQTNNNSLAEVAVLMPVYNAEKHLREAIDSILNQTYTAFDFYIVNDGSTDGSEEIILSYKDPRIRYLKNEVNSGIVKTLNVGLEAITAKYIVRMDSDDLAVPNRIEWQKKFMDEHPDVGVSSGHYEIFERDTGVVKLFLRNKEIKSFMIFGSPIGHSAAILRNSVLKQYRLVYRSVYPHMEDYDLWFRMKDLTNFGNVNKVLLKYRVTGNNVTIQNYETSLERRFKLFQVILKTIDIDLTHKDFQLHNGFNTDQVTPIKEKIVQYRHWLDTLRQKNAKHHAFPEKELNEHLKKKWERVFYETADHGLAPLLTFWKASKKIRLKELIYFFKISVNKLIQKK